METHRVIIMGGGPAGYTAGIYAARAMLSPLLIEGIQPGGQMTITTDVENYPGFSGVIQGPWLMEQMRAQAAAVGVNLIGDHITEVSFSPSPFRLLGDSGNEYFSKSVIIATGAQAKWLGIPGEDSYQGLGVSACATCDGFFYRDKDVVVVGGGNTAVEEALFLTRFARRVTLIHRRDSLRAEKILQQRLFSHEKISVLWDHVVDEIIGGGADGKVGGIRLRHVHDGTQSERAIDGIFIAIGHAPQTDLFKNRLDLDAGGYIVTAPGSTLTSVEGVFAAGDVMDSVYRQAVTAAGLGCMAALEVEKYLSSLESATDCATDRSDRTDNVHQKAI